VVLVVEHMGFPTQQTPAALEIPHQHLQAKVTTEALVSQTILPTPILVVGVVRGLPRKQPQRVVVVMVETVLHLQLAAHP
jgi:hypothetical protein